MNTAIGNALIFIGAIVFLLSAISIIYPIKALGFASRKRAFWILIASIAVTIAGGGFLSADKPATTAQAPAPTPEPSTTAVAPTPAPAPAPEVKTEQAAAPEATPAPASTPAEAAMPDDQRQVVNAIAVAQEAAKSAANDMQKGAALAIRNQALCSVLKGLKVMNWTGEVNKVGANGDGKGVLYVQIAPDAYVETWNNALSDSFDKTLLEPSSPIFAAASQLAVGQKVAFSGSFVSASGSDSGECVKESSMTLDGKIKEPEFIFRFSQIAPR